MGLSLNFKVVPACPYHTLSYHERRVIRQNSGIWGSIEEDKSLLLEDLSDVLQKLIQIPDYFSICIFPSKIYISVILQHLFPPCLYLLPGHPSLVYSPFPDLIDSGLKSRILLNESIARQLSLNEYGGILVHETDLISGFSFDLQELLSIRDGHPDLHLCLDVSTSFTNHAYEYDKVDSYLFNSEFIFGMNPGITVWVIRDPILSMIRQNWPMNFFSGAFHKNQDHPDILSHREVDPLKIFVFTEMCKDLVRRDPKVIRNEIIYKSILMVSALEKNKTFELMVNQEKHRSANIISARISGSVENTRNHLSHSGIRVDEIYKEEYGYIFRIGNFPVHSKEQTEYLSDIIASL